MPRAAVVLLAVLALLAAGCGSKKHASPPFATKDVASALRHAHLRVSAQAFPPKRPCNKTFPAVVIRLRCKNYLYFVGNGKLPAPLGLISPGTRDWGVYVFATVKDAKRFERANGSSGSSFVTGPTASYRYRDNLVLWSVGSPADLGRARRALAAVGK